MVNITLICEQGMSTSLLVSKMKEYIEKKKLEINVIAMAVTSFDSYEGDTDVLLLGPQVRYKEQKIREKYQDKNFKIAVINMVDYGMMNGENVVKDAIKMLEG